MATEKIDENTKKMLKELQERSIRKGVDQFKNLPVACPKCGKPMSGVTISAEHWECDKCGYSQGGINIGTGGKVAIGFIIGAGAVALAWWLSTQETQDNQ